MLRAATRLVGNFKARLRARVRRWALRRQGVDTLPFTLTSRRIYILPTRGGWIFALLVLVTFIAGMNYGNGLALLLCFWLAGFALVAMMQTQRTLAGLKVLTIRAAPAFVGASVELRVRVARPTAANPSIGATTDLQLQSPDGATSAPSNGDELLLLIPATHRGLWRAPPLQLESRAPFGLFRTWTWLQMEAVTLVYPRPVGDLPVPETTGNDAGLALQTQGQDELAWLRDFREGDSPRQVAWKAYARGAPLLVREYRGMTAARRDFDFSALRMLAQEQRLSQLCQWIVDAAGRNDSWILRLPNQSPLAGTGFAHREQCLKQLALYGVAPEAEA